MYEMQRRNDSRSKDDGLVITGANILNSNPYVILMKLLIARVWLVH